MILSLAISGYRSLRDVVVPLSAVNVVTGANGSGKSSFYRALRLLADVANGRVVAALAAEGGLQSTLWAGPEVITRRMKARDVAVEGGPRRDRVRLRLGFASDTYGYAIDLGLPQATGSRFDRDPEIKAEAVWAGEALRRSNAFARRNGPVVTALDMDGSRNVYMKDLASFDSMMTHAADPRNLPELLELREVMRGWRFYDHFRTDRDAPARRAHAGTRTPVLANDGADLAAALQTIHEIGNDRALDATIADAFPGGRLEINEERGRFEVRMHQEGLLRPLVMSELSDGTLRFLLLTAALLTPRPPALMVLNEPETSLHPELLAPLGRLIGSVADRCQVIVVTHAAPLVTALNGCDDVNLIRLEKRLGETTAAIADRPVWNWPQR